MSPVLLMRSTMQRRPEPGSMTIGTPLEVLKPARGDIVAGNLLLRRC